MFGGGDSNSTAKRNEYEVILVEENLLSNYIAGTVIGIKII